MSDLALLSLALLVSCGIVYLWSSRQPRAEEPAAAASVPAPKTAAAEPKQAAAEAVPETSAAAVLSGPPSSPDLPKIAYVEDENSDPTLVGADVRGTHPRPSYSPPTQRIVYDDDAADDEPTHSGALILVTATAQTDPGTRRKRNEDSMLASEDDGIFVVADGMGGYRGGEIASQLAVRTIERAFSTKSFDGPAHDTIPPRASELARAIQMANEAIFEKASEDKMLEGMGTTICAARFSPNKQRLYIGHVGDSRIYRLRANELKQMTSDHTMEELGVSGATAAHLSRAVGIWPVVPIDIVLGRPRPGDLYLMCSDGLSKMVADDEIGAVLRGSSSPASAVDALITAANDHGGKDNITVIVVRVDDPATSDRPRIAV